MNDTNKFKLTDHIDKIKELFSLCDETNSENTKEALIKFIGQMWLLEQKIEKVSQEEIKEAISIFQSSLDCTISVLNLKRTFK